jgi:hypothetical protein
MSQMMTLDEKLDIALRSIELKKAGDREGATRLLHSAPMPAYLAKVMKEKMGVEYLLNSGWNLAEAEAEFGQDWLNR